MVCLDRHDMRQHLVNSIRKAQFEFRLFRIPRLIFSLKLSALKASVIPICYQQKAM
jgi:hypothetical protein